MNSHEHARLTPKGRALLVSRVLDEGWTVADASMAAGVSKRTSYKWLARFKAEGELGLRDRSSRPRHCPRGLSAEEQCSLEALRRQRWPLWRIAMQAGRGVATVSRCMKRLGLSRLKSLEPPVPVVRYERAAAGELLHIDTKKLGRIDGVGHRITGDRTKNHNRGIGWDMVHLAIDDHSRVSFAQVLPDEKAVSCVQFLREAVAYYASLGVRIERVMTDNGTGYKNTFKAACDELGIRHIKTRPYTPKTNGKAERFVQTSLREWAYARPYVSSAQREAALLPFLHRYNWHRPHCALNRQPPMSRIPAVSNLLELDS
ncbi:MAG TPA: IS481 family transposase [Piscinibacter sp.]|uniref:IS481 family transposase n=1 Tax=Piscinibacter sp. TaxID=1903157 RepID=UPI0011D6812B|nr:MAG: IS481 family transposase [Burkholderiaceae bacterium]HNK17913.1 IS481 family transposase [Piscinibacter sp.]